MSELAPNDERRCEVTVTDLIEHARDVREKFYRPGASLPLTERILHGRRESLLFLRSYRFLNWVVRPAMLLGLGAVAWHFGPFDVERDWVPIVVAVAAYTMIAMGYQFVVLQFLLEVQLAPYAGFVSTLRGRRRERWFDRVRRWVEVNDLAGPTANRWLWDRKSREIFQRVYDVAQRRALGEDHPALRGCDLSDEMRHGYEQVLSTVEELPLFGAMAFFEQYCLALVLLRVIEGYWVVLTVSWFTVM